MASKGDAVESVDALIKEISDHIGRGWMVLARSLQFTVSDIDSIEYANERDLKEQIHQFFSRWKQRVGQEATRDMLYAALYDGELNELLKKLDKADVKKTDPLPDVLPTPPRLVTRMDPDAEPDSTTITPRNSPANNSRLQISPSNRLDTEVLPDSTTTTGQQTPLAVQNSPNVHQNNLDTPTQSPESDVEFVRRKRLERLSSNLSNNSDSSGNGCTLNRPCSVPEAPPPSLTPVSCQPNASTLTPPQTIPGRSQSVCPFELDDMVMVERLDAAPWRGVVRWIGELPETLGQPVAGIEMEDEVAGGGDGSKDGRRYFHCADRRGLFLPVRMLKKDNRFDVSDSSSPNPSPPNQGLSGLLSNTASSDSALNDFLSTPFAAGWRSPEEVLKQAGLNISPNVSSSNPETNHSDGEERVIVFTVPADHVGIIIGRDGRNIQAVERETNTIIKLERDYGGLSGVKRGVIRGSEENRKKALQMILDRLKKQVKQRTDTAETIQISNDKVGLIIGTKGQTIKAIRSLSGADIDIKNGPTGLESFSFFGPQTRDCTITGSEEEIEKAKKLIRMAENGGNIVVGATLAALIADLARLQVTVEERNNN